MSMALIREYLKASGYTEQALLEHFELPRIHFLFYPVGHQGERFAELYRAPGTAVFLARVLIGGYAESREAFGAHMPDAVFAAMVEAGLLEKAGADWQAAGLLFPYEGFFVCADRAFRGLERMAPDLEYVAGGADPTSVQFYDGMSRKPCRTRPRTTHSMPTVRLTQSTGPTRTPSPVVGSRFRCTRLDLYEQCSDHITEYMASSHEVGRRPRICRISRYSFSFRPRAAQGCSRSGVSAACVTVSTTPTSYRLGDLVRCVSRGRGLGTYRAWRRGHGPRIRTEGGR